MTGVPRNRDQPESAVTKLERAAMLIYAGNVHTENVHVEAEAAVLAAHALFDAIERDRLHRANEADDE